MKEFHMAKRRSFLLILLLSAVLLSGLTSLSVYAQISSFSSGQSAAEYRTENYSNGDQYTGYFVNGLYNGEGTYVWANGDRYEGEFMNGQIDGAGRLTFFGNGQYWEGLFIQGKINNDGLAGVVKTVVAFDSKVLSIDYITNAYDTTGYNFIF